MLRFGESPHHALIRPSLRRVTLALLLLLVAGCGGREIDSNLPGSPGQARVLIIGMDGTRAEALELADTPHLDQLRAGGLEDMHAITGDVSLSGPGWASMLTGVWCDKHRVVDNDATWAQSRFDRYPHFFRRLKQAQPDVVTASISHWAAINDEILCAAESGDDCGATDHVANVATDAEVRDRVVALLQSANPHAIFMQFDDIDHAGHGDPESLDPGGFCPFAGGDLSEGEENGVCLPANHNPAYVATIETTDSYIGDILQALYARPDFARENWLILVSPDHGGGGAVFNQHGFPVAQDRRTFFIMAGNAVSTEPLVGPIPIVDIAATALTHMGVALQSDWNLDGQAVGLKNLGPYEPREIPSCYDPAIFVPDTGTSSKH